MRRISNGNLPWLLPAPEDFRAKLKALVDLSDAEFAASVRQLATFDLDINQLLLLQRFSSGFVERLSSQGFQRLRLAFLAENTTDYLVPSLQATCLRYGLLTDVYVPPYGQGKNDVMHPGSQLYKFSADIAVVAESAQSLGLASSTSDSDSATQSVASALSTIEIMVKTLRNSGIVNVVVQTLPQPALPWCGHFDRRAPGSAFSLVNAFNEGLSRIADENSAILFDIDRLAGLVGRDMWFDDAEWHRTKSPFSLTFVPLFTDHLARVLAATRGKSRKCLVLDLDNTCWGGVIGDDGLDGIRIGQGSAEGESFVAVQSLALSLKRRGVILAVCSKNEESVAKKPFESHPDMLLRLDDFAIFVANWTDKASNLVNIAKSLEIGTDALVFLDDNPAERARVRQMLPEVAVPEISADSSTYPSILSQAGYFEAISLTADDLQRAEQYRSNAARRVELEQIGDYDTYLSSLNMICDIRHFDDVGRARIAQLINKSNQFNLTTRRYTEAEVHSFQNDPAIFHLQVRLVDRFGDNGMISVVIFRKRPDHWVCDTWLMSCRVLGRRVEESILCVVAAQARNEGVNLLIGEYLPTKKNEMVAEHFGKLGFILMGPTEIGGTRWQLDLDQYQPPELPHQFTGLAESLITNTQKKEIPIEQ